MDPKIQKLSDLLHEVAETHHIVYKITEGDDPNWAYWYANQLIDLTNFSEITGSTPVKSELIYMLVKLDKDFTLSNPGGKWEDYYAKELLEHFAK